MLLQGARGPRMQNLLGWPVADTGVKGQGEEGSYNRSWADAAFSKQN